ncbi:unnamed protein product [Discula destructiva]
MAGTDKTDDLLVNITTHFDFTSGSPNSIVFTPISQDTERGEDGGHGGHTYLCFPAVTINLYPPANSTPPLAGGAATMSPHTPGDAGESLFALLLSFLMLFYAWGYLSDSEETDAGAEGPQRVRPLSRAREMLQRAIDTTTKRAQAASDFFPQKFGSEELVGLFDYLCKSAWKLIDHLIELVQSGHTALLVGNEARTDDKPRNNQAAQEVAVRADGCTDEGPARPSAGDWTARPRVSGWWDRANLQPKYRDDDYHKKMPQSCDVQLDAARKREMVL